MFIIYLHVIDIRLSTGKTSTEKYWLQHIRFQQIQLGTLFSSLPPPSNKDFHFDLLFIEKHISLGSPLSHDWCLLFDAPFQILLVSLLFPNIKYLSPVKMTWSSGAMASGFVKFFLSEPLASTQNIADHITLCFDYG